ncbi:MAG: HEPN domain-containing protein [Desulfurococcaceae archaeon TW002]
MHQEVSELLTKEEYVILLTKLEDTYISARYFPRRYEDVEARILLRFVKKVFKPIVERG